MKDIDRWVVWRAGPLKPKGKFDKIPCSPSNGQNIDGQDPANWLSYGAAVAAYDRDVGNGIGIVLSADHTVHLNGEAHYLIALDFDNCAQSIDTLKELWLGLGKPYAEVSPSGSGLRMFALSREPLKGGNDGNGHELYGGGRFMTVTGQRRGGQVRDATAGLAELHREWFGTKTREKGPEPGSSLRALPPAETDQNIARVKEQLSFVSSDTDYETWRNVVWSVLSTGWTCAEAVAKAWSMEAADRYDEAAFDNLVGSFDPDRGITLGTLHHFAEQNGWTRPLTSDSAEPLVTQGAPKRGRLLTSEEVKALPNLLYRVRGLLPAQGVASIYGESGSGKSFLAMDMCFSIAAGRPDWFGMAVKPAPLVYIALEGRGGVSKRIKAWEKHNQQAVAGRVRFLLSDFSILVAEGVDKLAAEIVTALGPGVVVVVDTLNQSAPGADENASADMSRVLGNAKRLAERVQGLVLLVHHAGKDRTRGMRGHSSLFAAMDAVVEVTTAPLGRSWIAAKAKDDEAGLSYDFELVRYVVDVDEDGLDVTSCAVRRTFNVPVAKAKPLSGKNQIAAMAKLRPLLTASPKGIDHKGAINEVAAALSCPPARKATVAKETIDRLLVNGHLSMDEGVVRVK